MSPTVTVTAHDVHATVKRFGDRRRRRKSKRVTHPVNYNSNYVTKRGNDTHTKLLSREVNVIYFLT
jgi:hypothetical protein